MNGLSAEVDRPGPSRPAESLNSIDALRGLALFGVLAINLNIEFRVSIFQQFVPGRRTTVFLAQVIASRVWLKRFRFGPLEWLWRALMYGKAPRFRVAPTAG